MKSFEAVGKNIEDAVQNGLRAMNLTKADVDIKIINKGGWFSKAKVLLTATDIDDENEQELKKSEEKTPKTSENSSKSEEKIADANTETAKTISNKSEKQDKQILENKSTFGSQTVLEDHKNKEKDKKPVQKEPKHLIIKDTNEQNVKEAKAFIEGLLKNMNVEDAVIDIIDEEMSVTIQIKTESSGMLIGKHGDTMQAIQSVLNTYLGSKNSGYKKILVDVENYRQKQIEKIEKKARDAIEQCVQKAKPVSLDYMNSYERHIVHELVVQDGRVVSESFGKEPRRFVKIFIK